MSTVRERERSGVTAPLGERVRQIEWREKTAGALAYTGDVELPGTLTARILRSPHPHARIVSLDTAAVASAEGVAAVVTAEDFPGIRYIHHGGPLSDRPILPDEVVNFVGQEIAAVAAETSAQAEAALELFAVDYKPLPAVTTVSEALEPGAPKVHEQSETGNVAMAIEREWGDLGRAAGAERTVSGSYRFNRQSHACMETNSVLARWDPKAEQVELWVSTQAPYFIRKEVANALALERDQVIVHEVGVGGGFGSKSKISEYEALAAALSIKSRRPVRLVLSRDEEFATTKSRHDFEVSLETGAEVDGSLTHRSAEMRVDNGAYNHSGPSVMGYGTLVMGSLYRTGGVRLHSDLVYTNKQPGGQFRGYGGPQVTFAIESQMDELAESMGIDPIDLRIRNANQPGDVTHTGWKLTSARLVECLERAREESDWEAKRALAGSGRGIGIAAAIHVSGANVYEGAEKSAAAVDVRSDGRAVVRFGGADAGTGQATMLAQVAATELGLGLDQVEVLTMESDKTPEEMGAWSSRGTFMSGHAVGAAARAAATRLRELAAENLGGNAEDVELAGGRASIAGESIDVAELVLAAGGGEPLSFEEEVVVDSEPVDRATGISNLSGAYSFAAQVVEVEVDRGTGQVRVVDVIAVHDSGTALNPVGLEGQIVGGVAMGLGAALGEELVSEHGRLANGAYIDYPLPRAADLPRIRPVVLDGDDPAGPYGAKAIGEIGLSPTAAAVANAVAHATGARIRELPLTPDKVLGALAVLEGRSPRSYRLWRRPNRWWISGVRAVYPRGVGAMLHRFGTRFARPLPRRKLEEITTPVRIDEAVDSLANTHTAAPIGGGTDLVPARRQGVAAPDRLVDVTTVDELNITRESQQGDLMIGGAVRLSSLARQPETFGDALAETAGRIASPQIREMATVAGNLCQQKRCWFYRSGFQCYKRGGATCPCYAVTGDHRFYHAAMDAHRCQAVTPSDLATTLVALDAEAVIANSGGDRTMPLTRFYRGPGETVLSDKELLTKVIVPAAARRRVTCFEKLRLWEGDFAVASCCASLELGEDGSVTDARVVLGAIAPTPTRLKDVERGLVGHDSGEHADLDELSTSWTWRGHPLPGNEWKLDAASALVRRSLERCLEPGGQSEVGTAKGGRDDG